jgi:Predicted HD-superfamily hydrolase
MIKDFKNITSGLIKGTFIISKIDYKPFSNKPGSFLTCEFTDSSGSMKGLMWDGFLFYKPWLKNKTVVEVSGELNTYKDATQIQIKSMSPAKDINFDELVPSLPSKKILEICSKLEQIKKSMKNEVCAKIWDEILLDKPFGKIFSFRQSFLTCPGGVGEVHHNYIGGLAEHSYSMMLLGGTICQHQDLDLDIVLTGCLVHDMGKIQCYNWYLCIEMTDIGRLLHHTSVGYGMLLEIAEKRKIPIDNPTFLKLAHIIIAHHEDVGIRKTMFAEANAVSHIDALDALVTHAKTYSMTPENKIEDTNWTKYCNLTQRQYYIPVLQEKIPDTPPQTPDTDIIDDLFGDK